METIIWLHDATLSDNSMSSVEIWSVTEALLNLFSAVIERKNKNMSDELLT